MTRKERLVAVAESFQSLELAGNVNGSVSVVTNVKRDNSDRVAGDQESVLFAVIKGECIDSVYVLEKVQTLLFVKSQNDFAVRTRAERVLACKFIPYCLMVINLSVDCQHLAAVGRIQRLPSGKRVHDCQSLVSENAILSGIDTAPVRSAVSDLCRHLKSFCSPVN